MLQSADGTVSDAYIAYEAARARGGAGLQVLSAAAIDDLSMTNTHQLRLDSDNVIPGLKAMAHAIHEHGGVVFAQLLQAGRELYGTADGTLPVAYSASATPSELYRVVPREMSKAMIDDIIMAYAAAARRAIEGDLDGVEICGNQGNLPSQFLAAATNRRTDEYGGSLENRMRLVIEICQAVRAAVGQRIAFGLRLSADEIEHGVTEEESLALCRALDEQGLVDYFSLVLGSPATRNAAAHIIASMNFKTGYVGPYAQRIKQAVTRPVIATGRFNTPQSAEAALAAGQADACGMTRAMICDPELANKLSWGRPDDIRACIGCLQACIGHWAKGVGVSCIQFPESGRELEYAGYPPARVPKKILVAGAGPAGMKAASIAALRGHKVVLCEAAGQLGGQVQLAQRLPLREEFGGLITNLAREVELSGAELRLNTLVDAALVADEQPDAIVIATGGRTVGLGDENLEGAHVVTADQVLSGQVQLGPRVVIADSRSDWTGVGLAEALAAQGHHVRLAVTTPQAGEFMPRSLRDGAMGRLFKARVEIIPYARLFGADAETAYFQHIMVQEAIVLDGVDSLVLCYGVEADRALELALEGLGVEKIIVGDCLTPRTAEEAVLDGLKAGMAL